MWAKKQRRVKGESGGNGWGNKLSWGKCEGDNAWIIKITGKQQ